MAAQPLALDLAKQIYASRANDMADLNEGQRRAVKISIVNNLMKNPALSTTDAPIDDELAANLLKAKADTLRAEKESGAVGRTEKARSENKLFSGDETLPLSVQAARLGEIEKQKEADLQAKGVSTKEDLPAGDWKLGFGVDPVNDVKNVLSDYFGQPVKTFRSGENIIYLDPVRNKPVKVNPTTMAKVGMAFPYAGDIAGTIGGGAFGAAVTKSPAGVVAGESLGSAAGTGIMEYIRLMTGKVAGVHDLDNSEMLKRSGIESVKAGAATATAGGLTALAKGIKNFLSGNILTPEEALKHGLSVEQGRAVFDEVNKLAGEKGAIKGTLFKVTGDPVHGATEAEIRRNVAHASDFSERDIADQLGLVKALDSVTKPGKENAGEAIQDVITNRLKPRMLKSDRIVSANEELLSKRLNDIGKVSKGSVGKPIRDVIIEKRDSAKAAEDYAWDSIRGKFGFDETTKTFGIKLPEGEGIKRLKGIYARRARTATTRAAKKGVAGVFVAEQMAKKAQPVVKELKRGKITTFPKQPKKKIKLEDLEDYRREISSLKSDLRALRKGRQYGDVNERDLKETINTLEKDRDVFLVKSGREDLLSAIKDAEVKTAKFHDVYDKSIIGDLTAKNANGVYKVKDKEFVNEMLRMDKGELNDLVGVVKSSPEVMTLMKEGLADAYKKVAYPEGRLNKIASNKFIMDNYDNLSVFFSPRELNEFKATGNLFEKVAKQRKKLDNFVKVLNTKWPSGKLLKMDPDNLVRFVSGKSGKLTRPSNKDIETIVSKVRTIKNITKNYPDAYKKFQSDYSTQLRDSLVDPVKGIVSPSRIIKAVNNDKDVIIEIMGKKYYDNLVTVSNAAKMLERKATGLSASEIERGLIQIMRGTYAPPLTKRGRVFTAALIFNEKRTNDALAKAILDPESLKKTAELLKHGRIGRETAELALSLGFIGQAQEE